MPYPPSAAAVHPQIDLVSGDLEALATHMRHCATARGRWFAMRSNLHEFRAMAAGRIVTIACLALAVGAGVFAVA